MPEIAGLIHWPPFGVSWSDCVVQLIRFVQAEPQELWPLAWSFGYFFCLLCGYYILRPVRDEMAIQGGVHNLPWMMTGTFLTLLAVTPLFGWLSARYSRYRLAARRLSRSSSPIWSACISLMTSQQYIEWVARGFFVWLSVFNLFVVSVFWSFMADLFTPAQGARLFGVIAAGGSTGALFGPLITTGLTYVFPVPVLMLVSAVFLLACLGCIYKLEVWSRSRSVAHRENSGEPLGGGFLAGIRLVWSSPYLLGICGYLTFLTMTATFLYFEQVRLVAEHFDTTGSQDAPVLHAGFRDECAYLVDSVIDHESCGGAVRPGDGIALSAGGQSPRFCGYRPLAWAHSVRELFRAAPGGGVCALQTCARGAVHGRQSRGEIQSEEFYRYCDLASRRCLYGMGRIGHQGARRDDAPNRLGVGAAHVSLGLAWPMAGRAAAQADRPGVSVLWRLTS